MISKIKNAIYLIRYAWRKCKRLFFTTSVKYIFSSVLPLIGIVGIGSIVDALVAGKSTAEVSRKGLYYEMYEKQRKPYTGVV
ncbi:MAG: hypothetical protein VB118_08405 [Oscillospiraceae bacterium]|nr:hypothetical protein [Oscillospiraceae bacterium]